MRIESIHIEEGFFKRDIDFTASVNLIHSIKNSCGKTTLLRFILYALGYQIPNTKRIKFDHCDVRTKIWCENQGELILERENTGILNLIKDKEQKTYVLPDQEDEIHSVIFSTDEPDILHNILGSFYIDQEKGWTLLNRGVVIGSIHFNIEELVRGLSGIDCTKLIAQGKELDRQISKYKEMSGVAAYRDQIQEEAGYVGTDTFEEEANTELDLLIIEQSQLKKELRRISTTISDNNRFKKFITDMKLLVKGPNDEIIPVNENNIVSFNDITDLLKAKRKMISTKLHDVDSKIEKLNNQKIKENEQLQFIKMLSPIEAFDKSVSRIPLDSRVIDRKMKDLKEQRKLVQDRISRTTNMNNSVSKEISDDIIAYAKELGVGDEDSISPSYLYTSNLKELSGAVLHKTVFAFRMAYIKSIEKKLKIKLPIILDSPTGKEVDKSNVALMMKILERDFSDHQIIIASIYDNYFNDEYVIEIKDKLINEMTTC